MIFFVAIEISHNAEKKWRIGMSNDPIAASLRTDMQHADAVGLMKTNTSVSGIYDLTALNEALAAAGQPTVSADGLGTS